MNITFVDGILRIYNEGEKTPWLEQPYWPDFTPWADEEEARAWGQAAVLYSYNDPKDPIYPKPADGPNQLSEPTE